MRLTILGSGDAFGSGGRFNTCFLIEFGSSGPAGRKILLDCGASSLVAMRARGLDPNLIEGVILSHLHGDHFGALPFLLLDAQHASHRTHPFTIAGPPGTRTRVEGLVEAMFPRAWATKWRFPLETASQSEGGFEKTYQGSVLAPVWNVALTPGTPVELSFTLDVSDL